MKIPCLACGAEVMPSTAAKNEGLCAPCKRGSITVCRVCGGRAFQQIRGIGLDPLCEKCRIDVERMRPTKIDEFVRDFGRGDCSLLIRLFRLDERLRREARDIWLGLSLIDPPERYGTEVTPKNCIAFAATGGNDVHFSLVTIDGRVSDESKVVMTNPSVGQSRWDSNVLVGENLQDFLSIGCEYGYSFLEDLPYDRTGVVEELENGPPRDEIDEEMSNTLMEYRRDLGLTPWSDVEARLVKLERQKRFVLQFSEKWWSW